ncbi:FHA domain-containing protein [Salinibacterium sp. SYSU T00001]|uniref:FHA domain-containing protein n=1 Tax=Homoserinimonas sedimenticola TaxID=2986805 RepID=UPI002235D11F|nr:FHA domain-containing protein [Salinibacterium sedimenticola]MCW4386691.1 FHA domain-containing protein [Salinibacterium sedimenticola]
MTCTYCGTALPRGAIFCGECGRRVAAEAATGGPSAPLDLPVSPPPAPEHEGTPAQARSWSLSGEDEGDAAPEAEDAAAFRGSGEAAVESVAPTETAEQQDLESSAGQSAAEAALEGVQRNPLECAQCGSTLGPGDIFCGECGSVSRSVSAAFTRSVPQMPPPAAPSDDGAGGEAGAPAPHVTPTSAPAPGPVPLPTMPIFVQSPPGAPPVPLPVADHRPTPPAPTSSAADSAAAEAPEAEDLGDVEETRIVRRGGGERYVLQFSTGESVTVYGTGLIGRNPRPEPGEYFDQLVRVLDTGRSVSKTHLEFGQEDGSFWIKDRFSGNGTVLKEPDAPPRRCDADRRCRVARGSRVEIGEQFFVVS